MLLLNKNRPMFDNTVMVNDSHVRVHVLTVNNEKQTQPDTTFCIHLKLTSQNHKIKHFLRILPFFFFPAGFEPSSIFLDLISRIRSKKTLSTFSRVLAEVST